VTVLVVARDRDAPAEATDVHTVHPADPAQALSGLS
jgi:hypothetical protein